jgi:hypothetical protein
MKKETISRYVALFAASLIFTACPKNENTSPVADTDLQSSVDASWALFALTDVEMMCAFTGVDEFQNHFYTHVPDVAVINRCVPTRDPVQKRISMNFNETPCVDGNKRKGEVRLEYEDFTGGTPYMGYYHDPRFAGRLSLLAYSVNEWVVTTEGGTLINELPDNQPYSRGTDLKWTLEGNFTFEDPANPERKMTLRGKIIKVLLNTADNAVFSVSRLPAINWSLANVGYYGTFSGQVPGGQPFTMKIDEKEMLVRDMTCSPDLLGVTVTGSDLQAKKSEFHPFVKGIATLEVGDKYPRRIFFGNEADPGTVAQCDNTGQVLIKGMLYKVNFLK